MRGHRRLSLWVLLAVTATAGCDGLLDVDSPSSIDAAEARSAEFAESWERSSLKQVQQGWDAGLALLSIASDEMRFGGPHGWWRPLDEGFLSAPDNAGLEELYPNLGAAMWMAEEAVEVLDSLRQADALRDVATLARAHLYAALINATLADVLENYAPSDLTESGDSVGSANMDRFYATAIEHASAGLTFAPDGVLRRDLLAARARAGHAEAVWRRIRPPPADTTGEGLVAASDAASDAEAALALDDGDWVYEFDFPLLVVLSSTLGQINCAVSNFDPGVRYAVVPDGGTRADSVVLVDPIDDIPDPSVARALSERLFVARQCNTGTLVVTSAREMRLIIAEEALARGDTATFAERVNEVRGEEGLTEWDAASVVPARDMLVYERQARLYMTGRRLADLYRFGIDSDTWAPESDAVSETGTLYPIPQSEVEANCFLNGSCR